MAAEMVHEMNGRREIVALPKRFKTYEVVRLIGAGTSAVVFEVVDMNTHVTFAAKVQNRIDSTDENLKYLERELRVSEMMSSRYLVNVIETVYLEKVICIVMEHCSGGDLLWKIMNQPSDVKEHAAQIFEQICLGVQYLHYHGIAHRDLKAENILVDADWKVKICDYGVLYEIRENALSSTLCGTIPYMSPEIIKGKCYCAMKSDIWSLGIILHCLTVGGFPWVSDNDMETRDEIVSGQMDLSFCPAEAAAVVRRCCEPDPATRATIADVLAMPFLANGRQGQRPRMLKPILRLSSQGGQFHSLKDDVTRKTFFKRVPVGRGSRGQIVVPGVRHGSIGGATSNLQAVINRRRYETMHA